MRRFSVIAVLSFLAASAQATTTFINHAGYGASTNTDTGGIVHVYAGRTGNGCSGSETSTCSTCQALSGTTIAAQNTGLSCNDSEIHENLKYQITLKTSDVAGYPTPGNCINVMAIPPGTNPTPILSNDVQTFAAGKAEQGVTATFKWSQICAGSGVNQNCDASFSQTWEFVFLKTCSGSSGDKLETGVRVNFHFRYVAPSPYMTFNSTNPCNGNTADGYENACHYQLLKGDEKVFITNLVTNNTSSYVVPGLTTTNSHGTAADASGIKYSFLRVYYATDPNTITTAHPHKDIPMNGIDPTDSRVDGLTNGQPYAFVVANGDQAGNVSYFTNPAAIGADQFATPEPVYGLLDGQKCFVATAAYGSPMATEVENLRRFRDGFLVKTSLGKSFVRFYYRHSPEWAAVIAESDGLRAITRFILSPVVGLTSMAASWNLSPLMGSLFFAAGLFISLFLSVGLLAGGSAVAFYALVRLGRRIVG